MAQACAWSLFLRANHTIDLAGCCQRLHMVSNITRTAFQPKQNLKTTLHHTQVPSNQNDQDGGPPPNQVRINDEMHKKHSPSHTHTNTLTPTHTQQQHRYGKIRQREQIIICRHKRFNAKAMALHFQGQEVGGFSWDLLSSIHIL
jgi:hypothetical protein